MCLYLNFLDCHLL